MLMPDWTPGFQWEASLPISGKTTRDPLVKFNVVMLASALGKNGPEAVAFAPRRAILDFIIRSALILYVPAGMNTAVPAAALLMHVWILLVLSAPPVGSSPVQVTFV